MGKSNRPPPIKTRKEVEETDGERRGRVQADAREGGDHHPSHPGSPFWWQRGQAFPLQLSYIKLTLHRLPGNGASPRLQQVSYT